MGGNGLMAQVHGWRGDVAVPLGVDGTERAAAGVRRFAISRRDGDDDDDAAQVMCWDELR